jgi:hypothetical protein
MARVGIIVCNYSIICLTSKPLTGVLLRHMPLKLVQTLLGAKHVLCNLFTSHWNCLIIPIAPGYTVDQM